MSSADRARTPKVLLVAEHASASFGGEALIPFQYFKHLRELDVDVHLLVHQRTEEELRSAFPHDLDRMHFVADSLLNIWCHRLGRLLPSRLAEVTLGAISHLDTQVRQRRQARLLLRSHGFDIVHEPIPVSPKLPSSMFGLRAPVVIGPMNGGMSYPPNYDLAGRFERLAVSWLRASADLFNWLVPGKRQAALLLVANQRTWEALPANLKCKRIVELVENGVDLQLFASPPPVARTSGRFRIVYVGRLVDWKRVDLLLAACARLLGRQSFELDVVGDGPMRGALEAQVQRLGLAPHTRFHGRLSHSGVAGLLAAADVMVLPSMHECGGAVVLEAMAAGLPVIATKWGGPIDYVTEDTGILIPPETPEIFVGGLAEAMLALAASPQSRVEMGKAGRRRVEKLYDWRIKTQTLLKIYEDVLRAQSMAMKAQTS